MRTLSGVVVLAVALSACAGRGGAPCEPVPSHIALAAGMEVFAECAVERKAVPRTTLRLDYRPVVLPGSSGKVALEFVVDTTGSVVASTIREIEATDRSLAEAFTSALLNQRFRPATVGGRPVAQLTSLGHAYEIRSTTTVRRSP
jgi:hypothetical protein